ncbi:hypothetical protein SAMN02745117_01979 [Lampropedia hyalina DSM 16112]|jgi:predicted regulator of Ras-like GTPase activity (Roadblock/LC7/MglB family)|uniref:Roadblock/LAMTOR2 domain-containing protein n=1 Tax=Lampropedia hyalina DSM 16112 TaxID=1122156 RepID=A0A1M5BSH5_9BURK|nr:roadblock/LC7 domain-containing protein [Lampropedia hyalina]SHF45468.1 hypothetical protein SAMN02745117_01979 [Lampropedia hyalina DSM 16112]
MAVLSQLPEAVRVLAQVEADKLLADIFSLQAVVIASEDGFDVASAARDGIDPSRIAAMASSIAAISSVVSQEAHLGRSRSVTIDTDAGFAVVFTVRRSDVQLVINIVAGPDVLIGEVMYRAGQLARLLAQS